MNGWLWAATGLVVLMVPLLGVAVARRPLEGVIALQVAGTLAAVALLLLAEGTNRQAFADLALALGVLGQVGTLVFLRFLEGAR